MRKFDRITPEGTKDYIFEEMKIKRSAEEGLRNIFELSGYHEVATPALEFFDVFTKGNGAVKQNELYTLTDCGGNLLALRCDSTKPIARLYAARLTKSQLPLKLYYNQPVFKRKNLGFNAKLDEIMQIGVEHLGENSSVADPEIIVLACRCMQKLFKNDFLIEIGHAGFMKALLNSTDPKLKDELKAALSQKNYPNILKLGKAVGVNGEIFKELPSLVGGKEVIERAEVLFKGLNTEGAAEELYSIWKRLKEEGLEKYIVIDPTIMSEYDYYTGIMFKGFVRGEGCEVLSGGRYDLLYKDYDIDMPAIGFAVNISETVRILLKGE